MIVRHLSKVLKARYKSARSVYIFGPRQSGKTTLVKETFPELKYVNLEDPDTLEFSETDPRGFFAQFDSDGGGIIDEPQRNPKLFSYLQGQIDNDKKKFILTSSQNFLTMESISQSLAGRITVLNLLPLSKKEIDGKSLIKSESIFNAMDYKDKYTNIDHMWGYILKGGYPELNVNPECFSYWPGDYVRTYLERDIRRVINVQDLGVFQKFLKLCAGRTGSILNRASLAGDCGISETSCVRWLSLLEQSGIIYILKPYYNNFDKRQVKSPKIHFVDSALCCYLLSIKTVEHLKKLILYLAQSLSHMLYLNCLRIFTIMEKMRSFIILKNNMAKK